MTDSTLELLRLINEGKTANEIATELHISNKQLYNRITMLKNKGFDLERKYYYDGNIVYTQRKGLLTPNENEVNLITTPKDQTFTAMVISDLHIGNELERLDLLDKVYDYCVKEGINIIINAGDLIDGTFSAGTQKYDDPMEQIDYLLKVYPFDKNILNFTLLGNHDFSVLQCTGQDLAIVLQNYRHDIIPIGYDFGKINIKNDVINIRHKIISNKEYQGEPSNKHQFILKGHYHHMRFIDGNGTNTVIQLPSLSDIVLDINREKNENILPTAVKLEINFLNGFLVHGVAKQLLIGNKVYTLNELAFNLPRGQASLTTTVNHEETPEKKLVKKEEKYTPDMSQIEKFNARYSLRKNS